jgi:leucyl/phenylalanyl-tRNA--protein transferase
MANIPLLRPGDSPDAFPDTESALDHPDGLLAAGGDLSTARLLAAYRRGIFPWYEAGQPILWWSPDPRAVLLPKDLHVSRTLRRTLRRGTFRISINEAFEGVISNCATARGEGHTWITAEMHAAYCRLHELGHAHSIEAWQHGALVGGLYGIAMGRVFFGESMFSLADNASKVALATLARLAPTLGIDLIDCQVASAHLATMGSSLMPRRQFIEEVTRLSGAGSTPGSWSMVATRTSHFNWDK